MPLVTVVLNSYNQEAYVGEAVESVLAQTCGDLELIAIDNGSTDGTLAVLERYAAEPRVRLQTHERNAAITRRFNQGVAAAEGDFVSFLYSDDLYLPTKLERQLEVFERAADDVGVVYGPALGLNQLTGRRWQHPSIGVSGDVLHDLLVHWRRGQLDMVTPLSRRACFVEEPFDETLFAEGEAIFFRVALHWRFAFHDEPLAVLRDTGTNAGKALARNHDIAMAALDRLEAHPDFPETERHAARRYRRTLLRAYGWQAARLDADPAWARSRFRAAVALDPLELLHPKTALGAVLASLPASARAALNRAAGRIRRTERNDVAVVDFPGEVF